MYPKSQGRPYTCDEVAGAITERGLPVTGAYLSQLRTGRRKEPRMSYVAALAEHFGVPPSYFFDDAVAEDLSRQIAELVEIRESIQRAEATNPQMVNPISLRSQGLSARSVEAIVKLLDQARELEGLPPVQPPGAEEPSVDG